MINLEGRILHVTNNAVLFTNEHHERGIWIPLTLAEYRYTNAAYCEGVLMIPEWLAKKRGLV